jgi:predicted amidophosphoribosyltransferase
MRLLKFLKQFLPVLDPLCKECEKELNEFEGDVCDCCILEAERLENKV